MNSALEWPFDFWDAEDKRRVRKKLERLNGFSKEVHVIRVTEGELPVTKRRRLEDGLFTATTVDAALALEDEGGAGGVGVDPPLQPVGSSRVTRSADSAEVDHNPLKSKLLPNEVMDRYLERAKKLRVELKKVAMSDHDWWLKTFDLNGNGVVKLWCGECKKDCGGGSKDHISTTCSTILGDRTLSAHPTFRIIVLPKMSILMTTPSLRPRMEGLLP